jgi:hypothetical protein
VYVPVPCAPSSLRIRRERRVASHREHENIARARVMLETTSQFKPVNPGNVEVRHHDVRTGIKCPFECLQSVVSLIDAKPCASQPVGVHKPTVPIILDEEHNWSRLRRGQWFLPDQYMVGWSGRPMLRQQPS